MDMQYAKLCRVNRGNALTECKSGRKSIGTIGTYWHRKNAVLAIKNTVCANVPISTIAKKSDKKVVRKKYGFCFFGLGGVLNYCTYWHIGTGPPGGLLPSWRIAGWPVSVRCISGILYRAGGWPSLGLSSRLAALCGGIAGRPEAGSTGPSEGGAVGGSRLRGDCANEGRFLCQYVPIVPINEVPSLVSVKFLGQFG